MLFIADAMRDSPNNPVVGLVDQVPPPGPGMPMPWPGRGNLLLWWTGTGQALLTQGKIKGK